MSKSLNLFETGFTIARISIVRSINLSSTMYHGDDGKKWQKSRGDTPRSGMNGHDRPPTRKEKLTLKRVITLARSYLKYISISLMYTYLAHAQELMEKQIKRERQLLIYRSSIGDR